MRVPLAGFLSWLVPGLGQIYLGDRLRGLVCLVTITVTFWAGIAIGGVSGTVNPESRTLWFVAQLCSGGNTLGALALLRSIESPPDPNADPNEAPYRGPYLSSEVGVHYTGVAGLLNVLVILDALACADPAGGYRRSENRAARGVP